MTRWVRVADVLFFATLFCVTFENVHWNVAGRVSLADVLALLFLAAYLLALRDRIVPQTVVTVAAFALALLTVYLIGFFNLETAQAFNQFFKGLIKFGIHFAFLAAGIHYVTRRPIDFYWRTLAWFVAGVAVNGLYGLIQFAAAETGRDIDALILHPITGGASRINIFGAVGESDVYRTTGLTGDPNHLGIMLLVPLLVLTPIYLRLEPGHRLRVPLAAVLAFLLVAELSTLSRSGLLGLAVGFLVVAVPYRHRLLSREFLLPIGAVAAALTLVVLQRLDFFLNVLRARTSTSDQSSALHFEVYGFIPDVLAQHPLFGLGLNNFSVYFEFVTGRTRWGAHSYYVALLVESGLVGTLVFALFVLYLFRRLGALRRIGRALAAAGDVLAARVRPLAWGLTAALVGTLAANAFYLTMQFYYFFALALFVLAAPVVFSRRLAAAP
jgi:O-Antigen ligase